MKRGSTISPWTPTAYCRPNYRVVRKSLLDVVNGGTAVRLRERMARTDGSRSNGGANRVPAIIRFEVHGRGAR